MVLRKRILAVALVGAMVLGSSITAFATETGVNTATGTGTNTGHLDTNVVNAILPTSESIDGFFNFTIDPEDILASADKFTDNTTAAGADFKNADLVYFKQATGATKPYASTSQAVPVRAKNYVAADVTVTATIGAAATGKKIIPMAESTEAFTAATEPTLLLTLAVGTETGVITEKGGKVTATIAEQSANFDTKRKADGSGYEVVPKASVADASWSGKDVTLTGKVKKGDVTEEIVAPNVTLTWSVAAHVEDTAPTITGATRVTGQTYDYTATFTKGTAKTFSATGLTACQWSSTENGTYADSANISVANGTVTIAAGNWGGASAGDYRYLQVTIGEETYIIKVAIAV